MIISWVLYFLWSVVRTTFTRSLCYHSWQGRCQQSITNQIKEAMVPKGNLLNEANPN